MTEYRYDLALREWTLYKPVGAGSDDYIYINDQLLEYRLDRYLLTLGQINDFTYGEHVLVDMNMARDIGMSTGILDDSALAEAALGQIIGVETGEGEWSGFWVVSSLGQIDIYPGSNLRKPVKVDP